MLIDIYYVKYLHYLQTSGRRLRKFNDFIMDSMNTDAKRTAVINTQTRRHLEDPIDIENDVQLLQNFAGVKTLTTYSQALIHSQLFKAPLRKGKYHLYSMREFADLRKHTNSFVCFHDEGVI
jgi:hypothetical protein